MYPVNKKFLLFTIAGLLALGWLVNACKKEDEQATITTNLTGYGAWQLASLQRYHYRGDTLKTTDTLNTKCMYTQSVTFSDNGTYVYDNFSCIKKTTNGDWHFSNDKLVILSATAFTDTSGASVTPFSYARINNLGRNSLVLQQTDTPTAYKNSNVAVKKYTVTRYGFIHSVE